jgi:adenylate kinase family enzyme
MRKIVVIGCGGAGKSTFSRQLGSLLGLPVTHLDQLFWHPGWVPTEDSEWREIQQRLVAEGTWVMDGNYGSSVDIRLQAADTVVFLDFPRRVCLARVIRRTLASRGRDTQAPGCPDRIDRSFLSWIWNFRRVTRPRMLAAIAEHGDHAEKIVLTSPKGVRELLTRLGSNNQSSS